MRQGASLLNGHRSQKPQASSQFYTQIAVTHCLLLFSEQWSRHETEPPQT